jgi:hypothetical protein
MHGSEGEVERAISPSTLTPDATIFTPKNRKSLIGEVKNINVVTVDGSMMLIFRLVL